MPTIAAIFLAIDSEGAVRVEPEIKSATFAVEASNKQLAANMRSLHEACCRTAEGVRIRTDGDRVETKGDALRAVYPRRNDPRESRR